MKIYAKKQQACNSEIIKKIYVAAFNSDYKEVYGIGLYKKSCHSVGADLAEA